MEEQRKCAPQHVPQSPSDALIPLLHSPPWPQQLKEVIMGQGGQNSCGRPLLPLLRRSKTQRFENTKNRIVLACILPIAKSGWKDVQDLEIPGRALFGLCWMSFSKPWQRCAFQQPLASMAAGRTLHVSPLQGSQLHLWLSKGRWGRGILKKPASLLPISN